MKNVQKLIAAAALSLIAAGAQATVLTTTFASNNGNEGAMFDISNLSSGAIQLTGLFESNFATGGSGTANIWYRTGSFVGHETDRTGWTLLGSDGYSSAGADNPTAFDVGATLVLNPGDIFGILFLTGDESQDINYTNGSNVYSDGVLSISTGAGIDWDNVGLLTGEPAISTSSFNASRSWNGSIEYVR